LITQGGRLTLKNKKTVVRVPQPVH